MIKFCRLGAHIAAPSPLTHLRTPVLRASLRLAFVTLLCVVTAVSAARAQNARFDLTGPKIEVRVTRAGITLPIASVPNLQPGDRLWLHPNLPATQSVHYLMVLTFLRGTTNPPPDNWFLRVQTWDKKVRAEGVEVTVPAEAQEAVLFLAPVTGGDFSTLRSAVQGRPGVFVRASQDLAEAGFEQARIEKYIASMRRLSPAETADPKQLQEHSNLIAATLALKPNPDCVKLAPEQQYTCFTQTGSQNLLDDGHGQSIVDALTGGPSAGLISTASTTQLAGAGVYSAYVGTIVDLVHIMGSLHTAKYQYIPAIAFPEQQSLNLRLNTPPSFHNPKSVIVIGLPSVQPSVPPPIRAADPRKVSCLRNPELVLPVEGAPLVFSTSFAHDLVLHLNYPGSANPGAAQPLDIPLSADAFRGGLVLAAIASRRALPAANATSTSPATSGQPAARPIAEAKALDPSTQLTGTIKGSWGFDSFTGPAMPLQVSLGVDWKLGSDDPLIAGKNRHVLITSTGTACIQAISLEQAPGKQEKQAWKLAEKPNEVDVTLDVPGQKSGALNLAIRQFGDEKPATVSLISYNEPAKFDVLRFHAGDTSAILTGTTLDHVRQVDLGGLTFKPAGNGKGPAPQAGGKPELRLTLPAGDEVPKLRSGEHLTAQITLDDGRTIRLPVTVEPARPAVAIIGKANVTSSDATPKSQLHIRLSSENDLPVNNALTFSLKSAQPFPRGGAIEIASPDESLHTRLTVDSGSLILQDPQTLLATLEPLKSLGPSAFGPMRVRALAPDGTAGDWLPLVTLIRLPTLIGLNCPVAPRMSSSPSSEVATLPAAPTLSPTATPPAATSEIPSAPCTLTGTSLYFIDAIATDAAFASPTRVPEGFVGSSLAVPPPLGAVYYLRLRDDPTVVNTVTLPAGPH